MFRFWYLILTHIHLAIIINHRFNKARKNMDTMTRDEIWKLLRSGLNFMLVHSKCPLVFDGVENLPKEGGYLLMPNHQGKWDGVVMSMSHEKPMGFVIDVSRSNMPVEKAFIDASRSIRLDRTSGKAAFAGLQEMTYRAAEGEVFCVFPEGGYEDNGNSMRSFSSSCFHFLREKPVTIVPVCIKDSYRVFNYHSFSQALKRVTVEVHFLKPITADEYKGLGKAEISDLVKSRIQEKMDEINGNPLA